MTSRDADLRSIIDGFIRDYLEVPANNHLGPGSEGKAWVDVLVGFSSGADPLYQDLKEHVGPFHWTPLEAFRLAGCSAADDTGGADDPSVESPAADTQAGATGPAIAGLSAASDPVADPGSGVAAEDLTVVSWALCQSEEAKESNSREARYPSETWARARMFGQECNNALHTSLLAALKEAGYPAVAPALLPEWSQQPSERFFIASSWSERHVAHVSGLGTFGLTGGLLTEKGQAVRLGSVVVQARLAATPRRYSGPFDYCLFLTRGICARCVARCPVGSVREEGRDKEPCSRHLGPAMREYVDGHFGFKGYACGLCQTGVPCESRIPTPEDVAD